MSDRDIDKPLKGRSRRPSRFGGILGVGLVLVAVLVAAAALAWTLAQARHDAAATRVALGDETTIAPVPTEPATGLEDPPDLGTVVIGGATVKRMAPLEGEEDLALIAPAPRDLDLDPTDEPDGAPTGFVPRRTAPARPLVGVPIKALVEPSEFGPLPRIGPDGLRPLDAYAQPTAGGVAARIAVVVGGLGLSQSGTLEAIEALPSGITLGFSPLGNSLNRWMAMARKKGHEVVLQLPMEPLGYPTIDPGPRTITSRSEPGANLANLRWALGRMTNYPVVMNYLGAGMLTKPDAMRPILAEIGARGVAWFDDGSVPASRAGQLARQGGVPFAKGTLTIDASRDDAAIRRQLARLESQARSRGGAAGVATAFPTSVDIVSQWARGLDKRGIALVPLSNLVKDARR